MPWYLPTASADAFDLWRGQGSAAGSQSILQTERTTGHPGRFGLLLIKIIDSSEKTIDCALNSEFSDFEDAIQCYTAQNHQISIIVTRNVKDYKTAGIIVQNPETFLCASGLVG